MGIACGIQLYWEHSSLAQLCGSSFLRALIPAAEHLYILETGFSQLRWQDDIESSRWWNFYILLQQTSTSIHCCKRPLHILEIHATYRVRPERSVTQPAESFLDSAPSGSVQETIGQFVLEFVAARQLAGHLAGHHPIAVSNWERKSLED